MASGDGRAIPREVLEQMRMRGVRLFRIRE